jgi:hypothetical protein
MPNQLVGVAITKYFAHKTQTPIAKIPFKKLGNSIPTVFLL